MPVGTATVTAKTGPGSQVTAQVLSGITAFSVDIAGSLLQVYQGAELTGPAKEFDLTGVTTFTVAIASGNYTLTIS